MESFSVIFYETPNGEQPAKLFLNELSEKQRAKTIRDLKLLETCGNKLREPTSKFLESGIYEPNKVPIFLEFYIFSLLVNV